MSKSLLCVGGPKDGERVLIEGDQGSAEFAIRANYLHPLVKVTYRRMRIHGPDGPYISGLVDVIVCDTVSDRELHRQCERIWCEELARGNVYNPAHPATAE